MVDGIDDLTQVQLKRGGESFLIRLEQTPLVVILEKDSPTTREAVITIFKRAIPIPSDDAVIGERLIILDQATATAMETLQRLALIQTNIRARRNLLGPTQATPPAISEEDQQRLGACRSELVRKLKTIRLLLPADLWEDAVPAIKSGLLLKAQIKAIETHSTGPTHQDELTNPEFQHLLDDSTAYHRLADPTATIVAQLAGKLG